MMRDGTKNPRAHHPGVNVNTIKENNSCFVLWILTVASIVTQLRWESNRDFEILFDEDEEEVYLIDLEDLLESSCIINTTRAL